MNPNLYTGLMLGGIVAGSLAISTAIAVTLGSLGAKTLNKLEMEHYLSGVLEKTVRCSKMRKVQTGSLYTQFEVQTNCGVYYVFSQWEPRYNRRWQEVFPSLRTYKPIRIEKV
jgi:hypothetical protein